MDRLLLHLGTSAVMDLLCHLVAGIEEPEPRRAAMTVSTGWYRQRDNGGCVLSWE